MPTVPPHPETFKLRCLVIRPEHDHMYWSSKASNYNTHAERVAFLKKNGITSDQRIDTILHLAVSFLPSRMYRLPNKLITTAWKDLPSDTARTMFAIGIKNLKKKNRV
tara:strand:+ start:207 stop:530 length:324 start_codon:yes stop_codon:yes gene_type:complete